MKKYQQCRYHYSTESRSELWTEHLRQFIKYCWISFEKERNVSSLNSPSVPVNIAGLSIKFWVSSFSESGRKMFDRNYSSLKKRCRRIKSLYKIKHVRREVCHVLCDQEISVIKTFDLSFKYHLAFDLLRKPSNVLWVCARVDWSRNERGRNIEVLQGYRRRLFLIIDLFVLALAVVIKTEAFLIANHLAVVGPRAPARSCIPISQLDFSSVRVS